MTESLQELFRTLASFSPPRRSLAAAPWEDYVDWSISQGLAPLAAYNLEFKLGGAEAPDSARDRLLSVYQGSVNDNVLKLVTFKRAVGALLGRKFIVLGGAAFAEALYPHVGFRPVLEVDVLAQPEDLEPFTRFLCEGGLVPAPELASARGARSAVTDGRIRVCLFSNLLGPKHASEEAALFARATPVRAYGPSAFRLDLEDAILVLCLEQARAGYEVPLIGFVDLRELLLGAPSVSGAWTRPVDFEALRARAAEWRLDRALHASVRIAAALFPEVASAAERAAPPLPAATRALLERGVVSPVSSVGRARNRGLARLRRILSGGR